MGQVRLAERSTIETKTAQEAIEKASRLEVQLELEKKSKATVVEVKTHTE